jgi:hypothetical protein
MNSIITLITKIRLAFIFSRFPQKLSFNSLADLLEVAVKSARRCAHDMIHCVSYMSIEDNNERRTIHLRSHSWSKMFYPADSTKSYRTSYHSRIMKNDNEICRLKRLLKTADTETS